MIVAKTSFINENLKIGKQVLESFNKTFPAVESHSMAQLQLLKTANPQAKKSLVAQCQELCSRVGAMKDEVYGKTYKSFNEYVTALKQSIKKYNVADCGHRSDVVIGSLNPHGRTAQKIEMVVLDSAGNQKSNHIFPVMAMKKDANINKPETWGDNAVIIDAWANIVMKAEEGINYLKKFVNFTPQNEQVKFNIKA